MSKEDSKKKLKEDSKEKLKEDSKEKLKEDSIEKFIKDSKEKLIEDMSIYELAQIFAKDIAGCSDKVVNTLKKKLKIGNSKITVLSQNTSYLIGMSEFVVDSYTNDRKYYSNEPIQLLVEIEKDAFWHEYSIGTNSSVQISIPWG